MRITDGGPAFPTDSEHQNGPSSYHFEGMTLRDYFAAKAMATLVGMQVHKGTLALAASAYSYADAMLEARK